MKCLLQGKEEQSGGTVDINSRLRVRNINGQSKIPPLLSSLFQSKKILFLILA
jgi:hypothetical protein